MRSNQLTLLSSSCLRSYKLFDNQSVNCQSPGIARDHACQIKTSHDQAAIARLHMLWAYANINKHAVQCWCTADKPTESAAKLWQTAQSPTSSAPQQSCNSLWHAAQASAHRNRQQTKNKHSHCSQTPQWHLRWSARTFSYVITSIIMHSHRYEQLSL